MCNRFIVQIRQIEWYNFFVSNGKVFIDSCMIYFVLRLQTTKQVVNRRQVQALPRSPLLSLLRVQAVACIVLEGLRKSR